jgi:hypothetical protein
MNLRTLLTITVLTSATLASAGVGAEPLTSVAKPYDSTKLLPGERMFVGAERDVALLKTATADTASVPVTIGQQMRDEARSFGPLGIVSGAVRGGIKGGVQLLGGLVKGTVGIFDIATAPIGGIEN